jgi:hypothetical protein
MAKKPAEAAAPAADPAPVEAAVAAASPAEAVAAEAAAPAAETADEDIEAPAEEAPAENIVDGFIDGDTLVPMSHPDNGSCDAYETDEAGRLLVPAIEVPGMLAHGFVVAAGDPE